MFACVACQPIFNTKQQVFGYELLYRAGEESVQYDGIDGNSATRQVLQNAFSAIGIEELTGGRKAFVNFTTDLLLDEVPCLLSNEVLIVEILESVEPTLEVVNACRALRRKGYLIALDDFVYSDKMEPMINCADIIKIDFLNTDQREIPDIVKKINHGRRKILLAEKIETAEAFDLAHSLGFSLFQGYFFCKPTLHISKHVDPMKASQLQLLRFLANPEVNFSELAEIIKRDVVLSYRLLRIVNSAYYGLKYSVTGILHALTILGLNEMRKWIALIVMNKINEDKPNELVRIALVRGMFMEKLALFFKRGYQRDEFFLTGLFSLADVLMDAPMQMIMSETHLSQSLIDALITGEGELAELLKIIMHYERGEWEEALEIAQKYGLTADTVLNYYVDALSRANQVMNG